VHISSGLNSWGILSGLATDSMVYKRALESGVA
jgi:hypothetical protein